MKDTELNKAYDPDSIKLSDNFIAQNGVVTPSGMILLSLYRHDYRSHTDEEGNFYAVDGGSDYSRLLGDLGKYENLVLYSDSPFEEVRNKLLWGSYGKSGKEKLHYIRLKDMEENHIIKVIEMIENTPTNGRANLWRVKMMREELVYRKNKLLKHTN